MVYYRTYSNVANVFMHTISTIITGIPEVNVCVWGGDYEG
jgi:hypothetical protein